MAEALEPLRGFISPFGGDVADGRFVGTLMSKGLYDGLQLARFQRRDGTCGERLEEGGEFFFVAAFWRSGDGKLPGVRLAFADGEFGVLSPMPSKRVRRVALKQAVGGIAATNTFCSFCGVGNGRDHTSKGFAGWEDFDCLSPVSTARVVARNNSQVGLFDASRVASMWTTADLNCETDSSAKCRPSHQRSSGGDSL